jgi:hypothetical protein
MQQGLFVASITNVSISVVFVSISVVFVSISEYL